ncbi:SpoIID/LytB domain-containing protein [Virgibacillus byunsanensis]|uniref:SpoIID/LytB domain-containing protein n=1 Tax=Virgibacillus byunsanensis TaxID=570945 RepID=A0ABW3LRH3_9BACI
MRYFLIIFTLLFLFVFPDSTKAEDMVTVKLVNYIGESSHVYFQLKGDYFALDPTLSLKEGVNYKLTIDGDESLVLQGAGKKQEINVPFILIPQSYKDEHRIYVNNRPYLGAMEFGIENKEFIRPVNQLPLEDYLKGVVPFEVFPNWGLETLKAQALAARTYAVSRIAEIIDDTIRFQVYGGYTWYENTTKAVEETQGEVITYQDQLINAFYSASNGGITENNANVWDGKPMPYFPIKKDPYDPIHPWEFVLHQTQVLLEDMDWYNSNWWNKIEEKDQAITTSMKQWLKRNGYPGDIKIVSIPRFEISNQKLDSNRSVKGSITVEFLHRLMEGTVLFEQLALEDAALDHIRPLIGGTTFKSYLIDNLEENEEMYTLKGKGFGHGVGMSQWGSHIMGQQGKTYEEIIQFYFPKTSITNWVTE